MRLMVLLALAAGLSGEFSVKAAGYDACSTKSLITVANVTTSYDTAYQVKTWFSNASQAATHFNNNGGTMHGVEGATAWARSSEKPAQIGNAFNHNFALGHHFHAFLLQFEDVVSEIEPTEITFSNARHSAQKGVMATGAAVYLVEGEAPDQPAGLRFEFGELVVDVTTSAWRKQNGTMIPYQLTIDDGTNQFYYNFESVDTSPKPMNWFQNTVTAPELDEVELLRLHRNLLAAHCLGDADMMAELTASPATIISGGTVSDVLREDVQKVFTNTFARRQYTGYRETKKPQVTVSASGDIGWVNVQVNASGILTEDNSSFSEDWAWTITAKKIDGHWVMAGNTANRRP